MQAGADTTFTAGGTRTTTLAFYRSRTLATFTDAAGQAVAQASHFLMKASQVGTVFPDGLCQGRAGGHRARRRATFTLTDETGAQQAVLFWSATPREYTVRTELQTFQIKTYSLAQHLGASCWAPTATAWTWSPA